MRILKIYLMASAESGGGDTRHRWVGLLIPNKFNFNTLKIRFIPMQCCYNEKCHQHKFNY